MNFEMQYDVYGDSRSVRHFRKTFGNKRWFARRNALPQNMESQPNTDVTVAENPFPKRKKVFLSV